MLLFISGLFGMISIICFVLTYLMIKSARSSERNSSGLLGFVVMTGGAGLISGLVSLLCFLISL